MNPIIFVVLYSLKFRVTVSLSVFGAPSIVPSRGQLCFGVITRIRRHPRSTPRLGVDDLTIVFISITHSLTSYYFIEFMRRIFSPQGGDP